MGALSELKFSRQRGFFDRNLAVRLGIAALFGLGLFAFVHFRDVRVAMLELGSTAPHYVVADVGFSFPDEEATSIFQQEAYLDIGNIYAIDPDEVRKRDLEFENLLIYEPSWRKKVPQSTFHEMYRAVERLERSLLELRFCDARTLEKMKEVAFPTKNVLEIATFDPAQGTVFPEKTWDCIRRAAFGKQLFHPATIDFVIDFLKNKIWKMREDTQLQRKLFKATAESIQMKYTYVPSGSRIIDQGERVTARHIAMLQAMKQAISDHRDIWHSRTMLGSALLTLLVLFVGFLFLRTHHAWILQSNRQLALLVSIVLLGMAFAKAAEFIAFRTHVLLFEQVHYPILLPFMAILLGCLINSGVAIFTVSLMACLYGLVLAFDHQGFILVNLIGAFFAILCTRSLRKRAEIFSVCAKAWLACAFLITSFYFYDCSTFGMPFVSDMGVSALFMLITAILVVGFLPIFESCFQILTEIALMECMDPNHELLRRLTIEAPGTYQHSLVTGHIAEAAASAIGASGLFCRVATLYHDIGKMSIAQYFTENQQPGVNIHQLLTPIESAQVIISHVLEGVALARKAGLPEQFVDIIKEHHGTCLVYFFYHQQLESVGGNRDLASEREFRYSGPKPKTKESVIIMIADSVEAASRSLEEVTEETLSHLVEQIVKGKMDDGQFDESLLTFEELGRVKRAIVKSLLAIGHSRVKYPGRGRKA